MVTVFMRHFYQNKNYGRSFTFTVKYQENQVNISHASK